jgi:hypothetical protein
LSNRETLPRISAATAALVNAEKSIEYFGLKSLNMKKIKKKATKKNSTTGTISRTRPISPAEMAAGAVESRSRKVRFFAITRAPLASL